MAANLKVVSSQDAVPDRSLATRQRVDNVMQRMVADKDLCVARKIGVEERWLEDLRLFFGRYDPTTEARLSAAKQSRLFVSQTRPKTNGWAARISDMLFPANEDNWGISPTPIPILSRQLKVAQGQMQQSLGQLNTMAPGGPQSLASNPQAQQVHQLVLTAAEAASSADARIKAVKDACDNMQRTMQDQLVECDYNIRCRDVIMDACKLGVGIMKGPMAKHRVRQGWAQGEGGAYFLATITDPRPEFLWVDPWSWFPEMSAARVEELDYSFERHLATQRELRRLAKIPGFDQEVIRRLLDDKPRDMLPNYVNQVREITQQNSGLGSDYRYILWEYHGTVTVDELASLAQYDGDADTMNELNADPLDEYNVIVHFADNQKLKWSPHPMDSGESLYSVYNFERDAGSLFGFGVPYLMRDSQAAFNAAWRMIMDNAGLGAAPQILIDKERVTPADGQYEVRGRKIWYVTPGNVALQGNPFTIVHIEMRQEQLERIINLARQFVDDETGMPQIAMGESASHVTKTAQGMAMLMNSVNVVFRRSVKNFDDQHTVPSIRRLYDWNMQFNKDDSIKGDYDVEAKGSSVLLVRELEAQNLMQLAERFTAHPVLGALTKAAALYRRLVAAHMLPPDEIVKTDDEIKADAEAAKKNPPQDPELLKLQTQKEIAKLDRDTKLQLAGIERDIRILELSASTKVSVAQISADLEASRENIDMKDRHLAVKTVEDRRLGEPTDPAIA